MNEQKLVEILEKYDSIDKTLNYFKNKIHYVILWCHGSYWWQILIIFTLPIQRKSFKVYTV